MNNQPVLYFCRIGHHSCGNCSMFDKHLAPILKSKLPQGVEYVNIDMPAGSSFSDALPYPYTNLPLPSGPRYYPAFFVSYDHPSITTNPIFMKKQGITVDILKDFIDKNMPVASFTPQYPTATEPMQIIDYYRDNKKIASIPTPQSYGGYGQQTYGQQPYSQQTGYMFGAPQTAGEVFGKSKYY